MVVYILQILKSRASYTTTSSMVTADSRLCISFKSWNQEHPIQPFIYVRHVVNRCVYPSNFEIKNILYNNEVSLRKSSMLCISFKSWNQKHPIQLMQSLSAAPCCCVYPSNFEIKNILYNCSTIQCVATKLCISFKFWNQEHPIQHSEHVIGLRLSCVYPSNFEIKNILYNSIGICE